MPFRQTGPISPLESQFASNRATTQSLANIQENDILPGVGMNPAEFLAAYPDEGTYLASTRPKLDPNDISFQNQSNCPSMYSGVSAMEATSPMTRQNSTFENGTNTWAADMIPNASSQSMYAMGSMGPDMYTHVSFGPAAVSGNKQLTHQDLLGLGANLQDASSQQFPVSTFDNTLNMQSDPASMQRFGSNSSTDSSRSTSSNLERRAKERHRQVLKNSQTRLMAKPRDISSDLSPSIGVRKTKALTTSKNTTYQRRKQPRVYCTNCKEYPKGFRGDHELQRHINAKHSAQVTKFVCRDPATLGQASPVTPKVPLKGCKSCDSGKQYGAYYNAAAHLRRAHFVPKTTRTKGKGSYKERRGGKAGGDWPSMDVLKLWYEKITVTCVPAGAASPDEAEDEAEMIDADAKDESPESIVADIQQEANPLPVVSMAANIADWQVAPMISEPQISIPDSQDLMSFPGQMGIGNSPGNLSYAEDGSPVWGSATSGSFASPALGFMNQDSAAIEFPNFV